MFEQRCIADKKVTDFFWVMHWMVRRRRNVAHEGWEALRDYSEGRAEGETRKFAHTICASKVQLALTILDCVVIASALLNLDGLISTLCWSKLYHYFLYFRFNLTVSAHEWTNWLCGFILETYALQKSLAFSEKALPHSVKTAFSFCCPHVTSMLLTCQKKQKQ